MQPKVFEGQLNGQLISRENGSGNGDQTLVQSAAMIAAQYWLTPQLWIKGGIGLSHITVDTAYYDVTVEQPGADGVAVMGAAGFEIFSARRMAIDLQGRIISGSYDGISDDLLTAGLGKTGLGGVAPVVVDPLKPTAPELRKLAIFNNYRAILDISANGGYGSLYGPNVDAKGVITTSEGKIAGTEYIAYSDDGTGRQNVTMMVQVPVTFNPASPCVVTATSSGSRGVYGAIGSAGEWGLKNGCAVAYSDKGTGNGIHDLQKQYRQCPKWRSYRCHGGRKRLDFYRHSDDCRARRLQCGHVQSICYQTCAFATKPRKRLGQVDAAIGRIRLLCLE